EIVHRDDVELAAAVEMRPQEVAADAAEAVDAYLERHPTASLTVDPNPSAGTAAWPRCTHSVGEGDNLPMATEARAPEARLRSDSGQNARAVCPAKGRAGEEAPRTISL